MARKQKLKVYRTPIGFHDAYVAAPSQKAALEAWGTDRNLFARGIAEEVDDPGLTQGPLANPGAVIKRSRGTTAEQIAALPNDDPAPARKKTPSSKIGKAIPKPQPASTPKPRRDHLDAAEQALAKAQERQVEDRDALSRRERDLARERERLERKQALETGHLQREVDKHRDDYERAIRDWNG